MTSELREAWAAPPTPPPSDADRAAIVACVRDYCQGWFEADPDRVARALHLALAKRSFGQRPDRAPEIDESPADVLTAATTAGVGVVRKGDRLDIRIANALWRWADGHGPHA